MLISVGNYDLSITDAVVNILTKNPYKFPRPSDMAPLVQIGERKEPAIPFTFTVSFIYEKCMGFLLKRLSESKDPLDAGIKRTIFLYPWQFVATCWPRPGEIVTVDLIKNEIIPNPAVWSKFFYLEISEAIIKYKEKPKSA